MCAGAEKTAGRSGEDPSGGTTKEATGNPIIINNVLMLIPFCHFSLSSHPEPRANAPQLCETTRLKGLLFNSSGTGAEEAAGGHAEGAGESSN